VPTSILDFGVLNSESQVHLPRLLAAQVAIPIANSRANDPAGKAILMIWANFQKNKDILKQYGLRVDIFDSILGDEEEKRNVMNSLLACESYSRQRLTSNHLTNLWPKAFSNSAWKTLNTPNLPLKPFLELRQIDRNWPRLKAQESLVYLRLYTEDPKPGQPQAFAKYVGRTIRAIPFERQREHEEGINGSVHTSSHHRIAREYARRYAIPMMLFTSTRSEVLPMAEMTLCALLRSWNPTIIGITQESIADSSLSAHLSHRVLMTGLNKIIDDTLKLVIKES
jgi:hypothetical protein